MTRPHLNEVPIPADLFAPGTLTITVSPGQWDDLIRAVRAYQNNEVSHGPAAQKL